MTRSGSTVAARRAGITHASAPTIKSSSGTATNVSVSCGVTPYSCVDSTRVSHADASVPAATPGERHAEPLAQHQAQDVRPARAERSPDRELARSQRQRVRQQAEQTDGRNDQRDAGEPAEQHRVQPRPRQRASAAAARAASPTSATNRSSASRTTARSARRRRAGIAGRARQQRDRLHRKPAPHLTVRVVHLRLRRSLAVT